MLHPRQFEANQAWIVFHVNSAPIRTERDGDFTCIALMDAASCFMLGMELIPITAREPTRAEFRRLLKQARRHEQRLPRTLYIPSEDAGDVATREAALEGIGVVRVAESELLVFIGEARQLFARQFGQAPE